MANTPEAVSFDSLALRLRHFWSWWIGELAAWVPAKLRPAATFLRESTLVEIEGRRIRAKAYRAGQLQNLDELDLSALPHAERVLALRAWLIRAVPARGQLALLLGPGNALSRCIELPRAAEENLQQTLAFELNRYTPFKASEVYFDFRVLKRMAGERGLKVQFAVAPKPRIDSLLSLFAQARVKPAAVVLADDLGTERVPLNLLPPERRVQAAPRMNASNTLLAALALALCVAALASPPWQKQQAIAALNPLVERAKREADEADRLKREVDALVQKYDFLLQRKHSYPAATMVVNELTRILPDGTWLQQLNLRSHPKGWEIQIQGETTISSRLAGIIEDSPLFRDASFKSPLVKGQAAASERFNLGAELEPAPAVKALPLADKRLPALVAPIPQRPAADTASAPGVSLAAPALASLVPR